MSARTGQPLRTSLWRNSLPTSAAITVSTRTDDPRLSVSTAPTPNFTIVFGGASAGSFTPAASNRRARLPASSPPRTRPAAPAPERVELIIDSLTHHVLTESIPVVIDAVGDTLCTAAMRNLDISATGGSIGEALLLLKEQIEFVYDKLNRRSHLSSDEKTTLQMLHTYIAPQPKKPDGTVMPEFAMPVSAQAAFSPGRPGSLPWKSKPKLATT